MKYLFLATLLLCSTTSQAALVTKEIPYKDGETELTGYFVYDDAVAAPMPGILVAHEWWGHNAYARHRAEELAKLGYAAFAIDMYGTGKKAETPDDASAMSKPFYEDRHLMRKRADAGLAVLRAQPQVDAARLGAVGYCFGGTVVLEQARGGDDYLGVVSFHGGLSTPDPAKKGDVKAHVLALNGADDKMVSPKERAAFVKEMTDAGVNVKNVDYPGALHAFTNKDATAIGEKYNIPVAYNEEADMKSWAEMTAFFAELFKKP